MQEAAVDLVDDFEVARDEELEQLDRPLLECFGKQGVVGVGKGAHGQLPGFVPTEPRFIKKDSHQLGDRHRRVGVVELDRHLVRQFLPAVAALPEPANDIAQRTGDQEVLLQEPQRSAPRRRIVRIEHPRQRLGDGLVKHRAKKLAAGEFAEIEEVGRRRGPEPQGVDRLAAVADDRTIVRNTQQVNRLARDLFDHSAFEPERAVERDFNRLGHPCDFPGIGMQQPVVGLLDLVTVADLLAEHAVLIPQPIADRRDFERRQ